MSSAAHIQHSAHETPGKPISDNMVPGKTAPSEPEQRKSPQQELQFCPSEHVTVGVELELQIVDRETGELAPGASRILEVCREEQISGVTAEFLMSMLEVKTGICQDAAEVQRDLFESVRRVRNIVRSLGLELALGGTHPFARSSMSAVSPGERYQRIQHRQGMMAYQEAVFGLHIHVGLPSAEMAFGTINLLTPYLPHLLALCANSPFWQGIDSGYASARLAMFRPSAHAGLPPHFSQWADFCRYFEVMHQAGVIESTKDIYWDIRPRPPLGTIEFRICDAPATLAELLGMTALVRGLVQDALARLAEQPHLAAGDAATFWLTTENKWRASRFGLQAEYLRPAGETPLILAEDAAALVERLQAAAEPADAPFLRALHPAHLETGAERQRRIFRETGSAQAVLADMKQRWVHELEGAHTTAPRAED